MELPQDQLQQRQKLKSKLSKRGKKPRTPPDVDSPPYYLPLKPLAERYHLISTLGNGSFGSVTLAKSMFSLHDASNFKIFKSTLIERGLNYHNENASNKKSSLVAIKSINEKLATLNDYTKVKEVRFILTIPYHVNLVQVYEIFIDNSDYRLHIVMECMDLNLHQLIKVRKHNHFSLPTLRSILAQVLNGIRHIHRSSYFHRDIKPENILISPTNTYYDPDYINSKSKIPDNFVVKIADYGLARHVDNRRPYTSYISTRWYRAPEILLRKEWYSRPVDIWAFGSVAAEVATFRPLFPGSDELEQTCKVLEVLGTPISRNDFKKSYIPAYGYWDEAIYLSSKLGLRFPMNKCIDIGKIIPGVELAPLCDVIRACLTWSPNERPDAEKIARMPYFKGTCVDDYSQAPVVIQGLLQSTALSSSHGEIFISHSASLEKPSKLAGISSRRLSQKFTQRQPHQIQYPYKSSSGGLPFLKDSVPSSSKTAESLELKTSELLGELLAVSVDSVGDAGTFANGNNEKDARTKHVDGYVFQEENQLHQLHGLIHEKTAAYDENLNAFNTNQLNLSASGENMKENLKSLPAANLQSLHSYGDPGMMNNPKLGVPSHYDTGEFFNQGSFDKYGGSNCYDESNIRNVELLENLTNKQIFNSKLEGKLNEADLYDQSLGLHNDNTRDSLRALYERDYINDSVSPERFNDKGSEPRFSDQIYSRFSLRRIDTQYTDNSDKSVTQAPINNESTFASASNACDVYP